MENKKKWYKTNFGVIFLLLFFFPMGLFFMWKGTYWSKNIKLGITAVYAFFYILGFTIIANAKPPTVSSQQGVNTSNTTVQPTGAAATPSPTVPPAVSPTNTPKPTEEAKVVSKKVTDKINNLAAEKYPNFEVTIWDKDSNLASEGDIPYEVILNGSFNKILASSCDEAKELSYYLLETFYKDNEIRPTLSRVIVTIPYYLRVSLGANDGVPMAQNGSFSGPTNFWTVMERVGLGESEKGEMKDRTWGSYLTKCQG